MARKKEEWRGERPVENPDRALGLHDKYRVTYGDGSPLPEYARIFVLRYDKDYHAAVALRAYASSCRFDLPELARDLEAQLALNGYTYPHPQTNDGLEIQRLATYIMTYFPDEIGNRPRGHEESAVDVALRLIERGRTAS